MIGLSSNRYYIDVDHGKREIEKNHSTSIPAGKVVKIALGVH